MRQASWTVTFTAAAALAVSAGTAAAAEVKPLRIGVLNDLASVYSDFQGIGSVIAARMAVEDYGGKAAGRPVEVVSADHQNKPDVGVSVVRKWFDVDGVDAVFDVPGSGVALAVNEVVRQQNKVFVGSGAATAELTGARCSPNTVQWTLDTWAVAHGAAKAVLARGDKSWFFVTSDYAFGHDLERHATKVVTAGGGTVAGSVRHPLGANDFSSFLLQAQSSNAKVIAFANVGDDLSNALKGAAEFGMGRTQRLVSLLFVINNVTALGLEAAQGLLSVSSFYWDQNDGTRAFAQRFRKLHPRGNMPNDMQAGVYASVLHYLKAVDKLGASADGRAVVEGMKALPTDDPLFGKGTIRKDGRKLHPFYLFQVKAPGQSKGNWDFFETVGTIPAEEAFRPLSEGNCPLIAN